MDQSLGNANGYYNFKNQNALVFFSIFDNGTSCYWGPMAHKYVHLVLVTCLERLGMPRNSVSMLTDHSYMTEKLLNTA